MKKVLIIGTMLLFIVVFNYFAQSENGGKNTARVSQQDMFSVWVSKINGTERKLVITDPRRQITHTRVSPDLQWVSFTRYNNYNQNGLAMEEGGNYKNTEICLMKINGTQLQTIAGPEPGKLNCNSSWSSDSKRIIFMSGSSEGVYLYWYYIETGEIIKVPTPPHLKFIADPHEVGDNIVFAVPLPGEESRQGIWMMKYDGSDCRQVSFPSVVKNAFKMSERPGDHDARLSPDGSRITALRQVGGAFHIVIIDVNKGKEIDLTEADFPKMLQTAEGVADWSSDGKLLIFRHIAMQYDGPKGIGIYVMKPDGTQRRRIPIPKGEFPYVQPGFFPEGSGPDVRVIYQTIKNAKLNF
ncbi:MAG: hypothetical protein KJ710_00380 [Candidatus Omnitrophica bacterium]|nr:hypothetical protein [Candidatus Omnitrophota bacterium]MBU1922710.1 hypothetical protein [Candidatus Omnitrophota bacterium]